MLTKIRNITLFLSIFFCLLLIVLFQAEIKQFIFNKYFFIPSPEAASLSIDPTNSLQVDVLNVGQGDAIYIRKNNFDMLIDGGPDKSVLYELGKVMPFWDKEIDLLVVTHPHDDHVTGLPEVLRRYKVKNIYYSGATHTAPNYLEFLQEVRKQNIPMKIITKPENIGLTNDLQLNIFWPQEDFSNQKIDNLNNTSIVCKLIYKNTGFLFMGDAEKVVEEKLLQENIDVSANVIKVGHHGSSTSSSADFLEKVNPQMALIPVGAGNTFGHPSLLVTHRLERLGITTYRTDLDGRIELVSDGEKIAKQ